MKPAPVDARQLFYKAFFISLIAHFCAVFLFSFHFYVKAKEPDPFFTFLGSILRDHDFAHRPTGKRTTAEEPLPFNLSAEIDLDRHKAKYDRSFQSKPLYRPNEKREGKTELKSLFDAPLDPITVSDDELEEILKIETQSPKRVPLKL